MPMCQLIRTYEQKCAHMHVIIKKKSLRQNPNAYITQHEIYTHTQVKQHSK